MHRRGARSIAPLLVLEYETIQRQACEVSSHPSLDPECIAQEPESTAEAQSILPLRVLESGCVSLVGRTYS